MSRRGREFWTKTLADLAQSGLKHREFALERDLSLHSLRTWLYKLRRESAKAVSTKPRPVRLLRVRVRRQRATPERSSLELAVNGIGVRFAEGTSVQYVAELARALRDRC